MLMPIAALIVVVAILVWFKIVRDARRRWVEELDLVGTWDLDVSESDATPLSVTFHGNTDNGTYWVQSIDNNVDGDWRLSGSSLVLVDPERGDLEYEVRLFDKGSIGINGPDHDHALFKKRSENIVPLRRRS